MDRLFLRCLALLLGLSIVSTPVTAYAAHDTLDALAFRSSALFAPIRAAQAQAMIMVRADIINVRSGPGTNYATLGQLQQGQTCPIIGRDSSNAWWQVQCPGVDNGWVFAQLVDLAGNTAGIGVVSVAPPIIVQPPTLPTFYGWKAAYFNNRDLAGAPVAQADVADVNFNWGLGSPHPAVPQDNFATRFERTINFNPGSYRFTARADDGVRVWIDNQPIIDQWHISSGNIDYTADRYMYGNQSVRVEQYDEGAGALLNFSFAPIGIANPGASTGSDWEASYFNNPDLAGGPVIVRGEARSSYPLDLDWGLNSPAPGAVANDNWSARWRGRFFFEAGDFIFQARSDDGVRVYIDGIRLIDAWYDGYKEPSNRFLKLGRGDHEIVVEFYERGGTAFNRVWWYREGTGSGAGGSGGDVPHRNRDE